VYVVVQAAAQGLHGNFFTHGAPGLFAVGVACFVLVWLALWTLGGTGAATTVLRLAWGADIFTVDSTGWTLRQVVGPFGRSRRFEAGAVERMGLRKRDAALVAEAAGRTEVLTTLGTPDERAWLRDLLRQAGRVGEPPSPRRLPLIPQPEPPPAGYVVEAVHDGSTRITPDARHRAAGIGCAGVAAVAWNAPLAGVVLTRLGLLPGHQAGGDWTSWLALLPFMLVGLGLLYGCAWAAFATDEWRAGPNVLEERKTLWGWGRKRRYTNAKLAVALTHDSDGDEVWRLVARWAAEEVTLSRGEPAELRCLGKLFAQHTGWPLQVTDDLT
jgi:hypothetical protein